MPAPRAPSSALAIALAGLVSLAVAMGIGRFAFTPLLPMMLAERTVTLAGASLLASANYFGYLVGALVCTFLALLELIRLQAILARQDNVFGDIVLKKHTMFDTVLGDTGAVKDDWR